MKKIWNCRRSMLSLIGMSFLFILAYKQGASATEAVSYPILLLAGGVAAANAIESIKKPKAE